MAIIEVTDLPSGLQSNELADMLVAGANAKASRVAPCLAGTGDDAPTADQLAEAKLVLVGAVKRWIEAGTGAFSQQTAGPFSVSTDTRQRTGFNLWPSEIEALQEVCAAGGESKSFSIDTAPGSGSGHLLWCDYYFTAGTSCSCGYRLAGYPIYEQG